MTLFDTLNLPLNKKPLVDYLETILNEKEKDEND